MICPSPYVPSTRLFAYELGMAKVDRADSTRFQTPYGTFSKEVCYIGTLTEINYSGGITASLRLSDPTGVCTVFLSPEKTVLQNTAEELDIPSFVYVFGTLRLSLQAKITPEISASVLKTVTKDTRNAWILNTAEETLQRISGKTEADEFKEKIRSAVDTAKPKDIVILSDEDILKLVQSLYEGKSAKKDKVIDALKTRGMTKQQAVDTISRMMENGDLYAPKPDILKVL